MQNSDSTQLQLAIVQHTKSNVMQYINDESLKEALVTTKIDNNSITSLRHRCLQSYC